jgi:hypothetical protein
MTHALILAIIVPKENNQISYKLPKTMNPPQKRLANLEPRT